VPLTFTESVKARFVGRCFGASWWGVLHGLTAPTSTLQFIADNVGGGRNPAGNGR